MPLISPFNLTIQADQVAYAWIIAELARHNGAGEAIYSYDHTTGQLVAEWHGAGAGGNLDPRLQAALLNGQSVVLHHNHPSNGSFIQLDLQTLVGLNPNHVGLPGLKEMWVHGNGGTRYRISVTDPQHESSIEYADHYLTRHQDAWSKLHFRHEVFESGWRHLVCLCLESKGYVKYEYDVMTYQNYNAPTYMYDLNSGRLSMKDAFPIAAQFITSNFGHLF